VTDPGQAEVTPWTLAEWAATIFAVDPAGTGVCLRARPGPQRERWLALLRSLTHDAPLRKIPPSVGDDRLLGGLDLAATLSAGRPVAERGILADADGGAVLVPSAERLSPALAARLVSIHDRGEVRLERDGLMRRFETRFGIVLIDEGLDGDEHPPDALLDRTAFRVDLEPLRISEIPESPSVNPDSIAQARDRLPEIAASDEVIEALCATAAALAITSTRAVMLALRAARAIAALNGHQAVSESDLSLAAQLVLAWRARAFPESESEAPEADEPPEPDADQETAEEKEEPSEDIDDKALEEMVLAAIRTALPPDLLARLKTERALGARSGLSGRTGALQKAGRRGRRAGTQRGDPRSGARLDLVGTLRAAAPWQRIRQQTKAERGQGRQAPIEIRAGDFRTIRFAERRETLTIFAVDASGSLALNRLAEAKGAVEFLLADCYVRRDQVALIAFRGRSAELILPPTRSLVRAKRCLSGLPGGGGTPLASGIDAAAALAQAALRRGQTPLIVMLTDGRANIARDGTAGRPAAQSDAMSAATAFRAGLMKSLLIDTAPRPDPRAEELAAAMGATYLALPQMDAGHISDAVKSAWTRSGAP